MRVIRDNIWLCSDCTQVAVNGWDASYARHILESVDRLPHNTVSDFNSETGEGLQECSGTTCRACGTTDAGYRARFVVLADVETV